MKYNIDFGDENVVIEQDTAISKGDRIEYDGYIFEAACVVHGSGDAAKVFTNTLAPIRQQLGG